MPGGRTMIEFEGVTKVFPGGTTAVDDVSLVAPAGRITVLMGPRGCGKTTLLRMANRMIDPSAGRVLVNGAPNTNVRRSALRRGIGYLAAGGLFPHRTVARNIETVPLLLGSGRDDARQRAMALLEHVGLPATFADKYPGQLSAGQQARVALARALAADPPILLLDAPFTSLEPAVRQDIQDDLLELQRIAPKTILLATEDIDEAIKLGDQIAVMDAGRLMQLATPQVLLSYPGSDYVADLLGRDRGIRKLTFLPAGDLPLTPAATVQAGTTGSRAQAIASSQRERWLLVLDPDRRPRGWVDSAALGPDQIVSGPVVHPLGGTFYPDESVLAALDAAILSPPGLAVCLDDSGRTLGVVSHTDIAKYLGAQPPVPVTAIATPMENLRPARMLAEDAARLAAAAAPAPEPVTAPMPVVRELEPAPVFRKPEPEPAPVFRAPEPTFRVPEPEPAPVFRAPEPEPEPSFRAPEPEQPATPEPVTAPMPVVREPEPAPEPPTAPMPVFAERKPEPEPERPSVVPAPVTRAPDPAPVVKEASRPTTPVPVASSTPSVRPVPANGGGSTGAIPVTATEPAVAAGATATATETRAETRRSSSSSSSSSSSAGGWEWRSDIGQWVQVEADAEATQ
ncbi:MAG: ATP-binding cassette domain-containing protein [Sporichthyaceae bacterium]